MEGIEILPKDIMLEILTRLPMEAVLESKLVCKPWRDVVRHPSFSQLHLNHILDSSKDSGKLDCIFLCREKCQEGTLFRRFYYAEYDDEKCQEETLFSRKGKMNLSPAFKDCMLVGSCHGLICFNSWNRLDFPTNIDYQCDYGPAYVCNPVTREYIMLPRFRRGLVYWWTGFGYVSSTNQYKVVRMYESGGDSNVGIVQVYTFGSGSEWRNAGTMDINMKQVRRCAGVFADGALHWADQEGTIIFAFSLADENFSQLPSPPPCFARASKPYTSMRLGVLGEFVSATYYYSAGDCDVWILKKNKDSNDFSWGEEFSFDSHISPPFGYTKSGRLLYYGIMDIYIYDPKASNSIMNVSLGRYITQAILHKNTLISLKALGEKDVKIMESGERARSSEVTESNALPWKHQ